jgi:hypothetical protein
MKKHNQSGMALVTVLLVLLVLTALAITASLLMTQEEATANRQDYYRAALYAAEAGLRKGELVMDFVSQTDATTLLQHVSTSTVTAAVNTNPPVHPDGTSYSSWDVYHLGTYLLDGVLGPELVNQEVPIKVPDGGRGGLRTFYSLYIRNNPTDALGGSGGGVISNGDTLIRIVAVGWVGKVPSRPLAVKILEEEYNFGSGIMKASSQYLKHPSGGNSTELAGGSSSVIN